MRRKHDDHVASHSNAINQLFYILSSSVFIYCYLLMFSDLTKAPRIDLVAQQWFGLTVLVVGWHVGYLMWKHNTWLAMIWFVKLATDPFTDIAAYSPRYVNAAKALMTSRANKSRCV